MLHLKLFHAVEQGIFYKAANIHRAMFNTFVDIARQKLSILADLAKTQHRENDG